MRILDGTLVDGTVSDSASAPNVQTHLQIKATLKKSLNVAKGYAATRLSRKTQRTRSAQLPCGYAG